MTSKMVAESASTSTSALASTSESVVSASTNSSSHTKPDAHNDAPIMLPHTPNEFDFADRTLQKMVLCSDFFPRRACETDWFRSHDPVEASIEAMIRTRHLQPIAGLKLKSLSISDGGERRSSALVDDASIFTAETASMTSTPSSSPALSAREKIVESGTMFSLPLTPTPVEDETEKIGNDSVIIVKDKKEASREYSLVPSIEERKIDYGALLGTGGFCEVRLASLKEDKASEDQQKYAMKYLSPTKLIIEDSDRKGNKNKSGKPPRNKKFERGIADLAIEARFLALLSHENIISLHFVGRGALDKQFNCEGENNYCHQFGFFMLLDPLYESLAKRIDRSYIPEVFDLTSVVKTVNSDRRSSWWKRMVHKGNSLKASDPQLGTWKMQLAKRLEGLKCIASALQYLHDDCRVVYRDIKPDNIGFYRKPHPQCLCGKRSHETEECTCYTDIPKLFDMGLCKELKPCYLRSHPLDEHGTPMDTYKLTARSGSRRYMSPEVAFSEPYNEKADTYSFGVVLYQIASLVTPYDGYSSKRHEEEILHFGHRPSLKIPSSKKALRNKKMLPYDNWREVSDKCKKAKHLATMTKSVWPGELKGLIHKCWHLDFRERPSMKDVAETLDGCIQELQHDFGKPGQVQCPENMAAKCSTQKIKTIPSIRHVSNTECISFGGEA